MSKGRDSRCKGLPTSASALSWVLDIMAILSKIS
jgi:hypothetical protein